MHDACSHYNTSQFQAERGIFQEDVRKRVVDKYDKVSCEVTDLQVSECLYFLLFLVVFFCFQEGRTLLQPSRTCILELKQQIETQKFGISSKVLERLHDLSKTCLSRTAQKGMKRAHP